METIVTLQQYASPMLDTLMLWISNLGSERAYIILLLTAYLGLSADKGRRLGIYLLFSYFLNFHLKGVFDTPRPYVLEPEVLRSEAAGATGTGPGFPSGHAQGSMTFWGLAALYVARPWFWSLAVPVVALISLSRIYLGLHLPVDVLGGLAIGAVYVALVYWLDGLLSSFQDIPLSFVMLLGILVPLALHLLLPTPDSELLMGGIAALVTAPALLPYRARGSLAARAVTVFLGIVLVFAALTGSSLLLPEELKNIPVIAFFRYLLVVYMGTLVAPALAQAFRLVPRP